MKTTIFYENSFGIISQYTGEILEKTETTINIKLSPKKAYKFDLKACSDFMIVCKKKIKPLPRLNSSYHKNTFFAFDQDLRSEILQELEKNNNIAMYWNGNNFN